MATLTRFVVKRKDLYGEDLIVESDGLAIGSALGSDVLLNHPTVSRLHAGIREIDGNFWITNLSKSNGTLVNGALVETVQLQPGDTVQIGIFVVRPTVGIHELTLEIDRQIDRVSAESKASVGDPILAAAEGKTIKLDPRLLAFLNEDPQGTQRLQLGGMTQRLQQFGGTQRLEEQGPKTGEFGEPGKTQLLEGQGPSTGSLEEKTGGTGPLEGRDSGTQPLRQSSESIKAVTGKFTTARLKRGLTGALTGLLSVPEPEQKRYQEAINAFWERRKQAETGGQKLADQSPLRPVEPDPELVQFNLHLGKKQFNWLPTGDLVRPWPRGHLFVFGGAAILLSIVAYFAFESFYSPGTVANPHALPLTAQPPAVAERINTRLIANTIAENNCAACHALTSSMQAQCISCHQTSHFNPQVITAHEKVGVGCVDCHNEHKGADFRPAMVARSMCIDCHRDNPNHPKAKTTDGTLLKSPHGGVFGYPIENGKWVWTDPLNKKWKFDPKLGPKEKFHLVHAAASLDQPWKCSGCHTGFTPAAKAKEIDQAKCALCHEMKVSTELLTKTDPATLDRLSAQLKLDCNTCHPQHGQDTLALAALRTTGADRAPVVYTPEGVYRGGKDWQWTSFAATFGGMTVTGWGMFFSLLPISALGFLAFDTARRRKVQSLLKGRVIEISKALKKFADTKYADRWESPDQLARAKESSQLRPVPHPVINYETCIGCHGCILACPQDVLGFDDQEHHAIVVNYEQCMEDTGCQQACPTVPQSCVLINTKKNIREAPKPLRKGGNEGFETEHAAGVYLVGDVSGVPLIRNAIKEGRAAMDKAAEKLQSEGRIPGADYDVAIIGIGPGGIAATARAAELGLTYVALEQGRKYSTIADKYPAGKYVAFNPFNPSDPPLGAVKLEGPGDLKETMLAWWDDACAQLGLKINEYEGCKEIVKDGEVFVVKTAKNTTGYRVRKVVLALGNAGEPRKLGCPGETEDRVEYRLQDPSAYKGKNIVVVGAGNSAVEAAVDLTGKRQEDGTVLFPTEGGNTVTLVIRSDFPKDLTLENKMWVYYCIDNKRIKAHFGAGVGEIRPGEVVIEKIRDKSVIETIPNDVVFAMIGSIAPKEFLKKVGIKYAGEDKKR